MAPSKRKTLTLQQAEPLKNTPTAVVGVPSIRHTRSRAAKDYVNPDRNAQVLDGVQALRASPDAISQSRPSSTLKRGQKRKRSLPAPKSPPALVMDASSESPLSDLDEHDPPHVQSSTKQNVPKAKKARKPADAKQDNTAHRILNPEAEEDEPAGEEEIKVALTRPPPVNSDYLPLPWKGRLGYACLNTYLRNSNPPVFSSRTCRIASILENRHPLRDPNEPPHPTKNRPDKDKPPSIERGQAFVEGLGLANAKDIVKMLNWNEKYGIRFLRLSSEMFPFASHEEYGYKLAPFASEALAEAGKFTQLGSPRKQVIDNAIRDLEYHAELLSLLKMPPQQDRDAVMILHLGGVFGDKSATLDRFRSNYAKLSPGIKKRLVLENDDVSWSVHDLLPLCEELNIPMVLDFHHHNIVFDESQIREGTKDIMDLFPRILNTWKRKNKTPKMHYSEPTESAITPRQRRKHSPRVATLPPCPQNMDLMIEAKDKEQAVFELMRKFKLPGHDLIKEMTPHVRQDDNKLVKKSKKPIKGGIGAEDTAKEDEGPKIVAEDEIGMGGSERQVYWPPGKEEWLRPVKRVIQKKEPTDGASANGEPIATTKSPARESKKGAKTASKALLASSKKAATRKERPGAKTRSEVDDTAQESEEIPKKRTRATAKQKKP